VMNTFKEKTDGLFMHGYTYSGHPTACAVALKNLEVIENEGLVENSRKMGNLMLDGFKRLQSKYDFVGEVRAFGLMGAIEIVKDKETNERFEENLAPKLVSEATDRGLICRGVIYEGADTLIFAPPLVITEEQVDEMINILDETFAAMEKRL